MSAKKPKPARVEFTTNTYPVRIYPGSRTRLDKLIERISVIGWSAIDARREAPPSIANVVDEALMLLEAKVQAAAVPRR